jgi:diguanylate cyclase (GGDEF)-like protein
MVNVSFLADLLSASGDMAYDWDLGADHIEWYGAWNRLFGNTRLPPANSKDFYNLILDEDRHLVFGTEGRTIDRDYRLRGPDGKIVPVHEYGISLFEGNNLVRQYGLLRVVEEQAGLIAMHEWHGRDELTGCFNRHYMLEQIGKALHAAKATKRFCAYLVIGIDKMSFVNEAVGMEAGDGLLRGVAQRLSELLPPRAFLGRVGGDMFGILLPDSLARDYSQLAERLLENFRHQPVTASGVPLHITVSIGGACAPSVAHSATEAMIFAEQALHVAHQRGHNLFVEYVDSAERMQENRQMLELGERVKRAFKNNGLRLAFQPIVDAQTSMPLFYEALVRIFDDNGQMIPAAKFVPVVEQMGLAHELDRRVLDLAVRELEAYPDLTLAINVSGLTAAQADWPDHVRRVLGPRRSVAERLVVEITETAAIVDISETQRFANSLCELGGRLALDDFGAGFTSIRHLRSLPLSIMKLDRDLLQDLLKNSEQQHIVRMLVEIARGLGLKTVAEGVEDAETAAWLKGEKFDMLQGYYFGKPALERPWLGGKGAEGTGPMVKLQARTAPSTTSPTAIQVVSSF